MADNHLICPTNRPKRDYALFALMLNTGARVQEILDLRLCDIRTDSSRSLDPSAVVLKAGRPLLAVPPDIQSLIAERVVIGWKDTREARRAVRNSLPVAS
jgi:integrase